jgi:hypothetical protein
MPLLVMKISENPESLRVSSKTDLPSLCAFKQFCNSLGRLHVRSIAAFATLRAIDSLRFSSSLFLRCAIGRIPHDQRGDLFQTF